MLVSRRNFLETVAKTGAVCATSGSWLQACGQEQKTLLAPTDVSVLMPRARVPLSFIIDDSTCLVNMGKFCMPQFQATYPDREEYRKPWRDWPDEIPDAFVREFGSWCAEQGVKGKYSVVPYPACVGWLDRDLPGWSRQELSASLKLVRELMVPNWDIHPEMITHTRIIDLKTGRPLQDFSPASMENSYPQEDVSVDYLASYLAYALKILKNCDLPCEGVTTPGGFGNRVKDKLPLAVFEAVRDVFGSEIPHYFKYVVDGDESTEPKLEAVRDRDSEAPRVTVNIPAGTGDWFGGWDGSLVSDGTKYANRDATSGRMVELVEQGRPAIMLCHWAGLYGNGSSAGYHDFQRVVIALNQRFQDQTQWMKISAIGRYQVAKEMTTVIRRGDTIDLHAPFACQEFTLHVAGYAASKIVQVTSARSLELHSVSTLPSLVEGSYTHSTRDARGGCTICMHLPQGSSQIRLQ